jgi:hypothetical protein
MKLITIQRSTRRPVEVEQDLRTPAGRTLPY